MSWTIIAALIFIGLVLLLVEILIIPGSTVVGVMGFGAMVFAIYKAYMNYGATGGLIALSVTLTATVIIIIYTIRSKTWRRFALKDDIPHRVNRLDNRNINIGDEGITVGRLAPSGNASFHDDVFEVHTIGDFIDPQTPVVVTKIEGYKIYVKRKPDAHGI
jgi:membrane-bound ClpP family serine protease